MAEKTDQISYLGQTNLTVEIISSTGITTDITAMVGDCTLYEDIFSNTMSGYVLIQDAIDLINTLPLIGQELIKIDFQTPTLDNKVSKIFYIYKLQNRMAYKRSQVYILNFCSQELISSSNTKISKAFAGNITDTVSTIFNDNKYMAAQSALYVEKTKNSYSFIAPYWSPLETINWLTAKSLNEKGVANFLFYETNQTYEFVSVDTLIQSIPVRDYVYSDVDPNTALGFNGSKEDKYSIVESIDNGVTFDYLRNLNAGMYASKLYTYDLTSRSIESTTFDYIDDYDKSSHLEKEPLKTDNLFRRKLASLYFIHKNDYMAGTYNQQGYKNFFLQRNSLLEQLSAFKMCIKVPGRTDIKVGHTITFTINEMRQILKDEIATSGKSDYFSGKYLITAIRHQILSGKHSMYLEIVSDSFMKTLITK